MKLPGLSLLFILICLIHFPSSSQTIDSYISNDGKGLYFNQDRLLPKKATPKLVYKKEIPKAFQYSQFYTDPYTNKTYLYSYDGVFAIDDPVSVKSPGRKLEQLETIAVVEADEGKGIVEAPLDRGSFHYNSFIKKDPAYNGPALRMPQHHMFSARLQALNAKRNFQLDKVLEKLNSLGLVASSHVSTKKGGFNVIYDRLFINDEDPGKFLVIWLNDDRLYANFLFNNGEWELAEPKIVHNDISLYDKGQTLKRSFDGSTDKSTLVTELSCIKSGDGYYIGYSITSWESSPYFSWNIASCHVNYLSNKLDIVRSVQIPQFLTTRDEDKSFASDFQMQLALNADTLCAVIQSPNGGRDKLFVQCFDKNLSPVGSLRYLSNSSQTYANLVSIIPGQEGFLITYKEKRKNSTAVFTQLINRNGLVHLPVSIYEIPDSGDEYIFWVYAGMNKNGILSYCMKMNDRKKETGYLYRYELTAGDYMKALKYEITTTNWKEDITVQESNALADAIDKTIAKKGVANFKKTYRESLQKAAYADSDLVIRKYVVLNKQENYAREDSYYYNSQGNIRMVRITLKTSPAADIRVKPGVFTFYYNSDGQKIWEVKQNDDGTIEFGETALDSRRLLYGIKIDEPFNEFHRANNN